MSPRVSDSGTPKRRSAVFDPWVESTSRFLDRISARAIRQSFLYLSSAIRGGRVMDPESELDAIRDVAVSDGKIAAISEKPLRGRASIDARGLVVAPGFVDLHAHGQDAENYALRAADGVTTALELEIGSGDIDRFYAERVGKAPVNFGASIGHVPVRMAVMGDPPAFLPPATARAATV